jgi:hypothetical protein
VKFYRHKNYKLDLILNLGHQHAGNYISIGRNIWDYSCSQPLCRAHAGGLVPMLGASCIVHICLVSKLHIKIAKPEIHYIDPCIKHGYFAVTPTKCLV